MDTPVASPAGEPYPSDMATRVAILEEIARYHRAAMERMERRFEASDRRFEALMAEYRSDLRWLLGIMLGGFSALLAVMAHGFHWL